MRVLVACEFSGIVREAFKKKGHTAFSCDLLPAADGSKDHFTGDVIEVLHWPWDLIIAHPPCTYLTSTAARWLNDHRHPNRLALRDKAVLFARALYENNAKRVAIENPVGSLSTLWRKPDQYIQPYQFGHPVTKKLVYG